MQRRAGPSRSRWGAFPGTAAVPYVEDSNIICSLLIVVYKESAVYRVPT